MPDFIGSLNSIVRSIPRIKTPIQLAALLFAILAGALVYRVDPDNIAAISSVGAIGLALVAVSLALDPRFIEHISAKQRAWFILLLIVFFLAFLGALAFLTARAVLPDDGPQGPRFDSRLEQTGVRFLERDGQIYRAQLTWQLFPLSSNVQDSGTAFVGMVALHDEDKIVATGSNKTSAAACNDVPSCIGSAIFLDLAQSPLLIRGGSPGSSYMAVVDLKYAPRNLRVWWEFYQLEGVNGRKCAIDSTKPAPADGVPFLATFDKRGKKVGNSCYKSYGQETFTVASH